MAFIESYNLISSLGWSVNENMDAIIRGDCGIKMIDDKRLSDSVFPASLINHEKLNKFTSSFINEREYTKFEKLAILCLKSNIEKSNIDLTKQDTLLILSTTKGNIELLDEELKGNFPQERINLSYTAKLIADFFKLKNTPWVVSNACISGVAALVIGNRLIENNKYKNVIVLGIDVISRFIVSGFQSFFSLSLEPCKPYDLNRNGLSLGEGAGSVIITGDKSLCSNPVEIISGATSNDANHISGPSRTGEGLYWAIKKTLKNKYIPDFISAHGTATPYNDDMESIAINRVNLSEKPLNSLKGYFGHTLGAAGTIESIVGIEAILRNLHIKTLGYKEFGVAEQINVCDKTEEQETNSLLKLASGFGGCNAAILFKKT